MSVALPRTALAAAALAALTLAPAVAQDAGGDPDSGGPLLVTAGRVLDGVGGEFAPGAVLLEGERIAAVGSLASMSVPSGTRTIDAGPHSTVIPGLVVAHTRHLAAGGEDPASVSPDVKAIDGYDFMGDETRALSAGVTTVFLSPGSSRVVSGRGAIVKTAGASAERRTLARDAGLVAGIGDAVVRPPAIIEPPDLPDATDNPLLPHRNQLPVTRAGSLLLLRDLFEGDGASDVAGGKARLWLGAETPGDLDAALELVRERSLNAVLYGGFGVSQRVDELKAAGLSMVLTWPDRPGLVSASGDPAAEKLRSAARSNAARLAAAGVPFALAPADDASLAETLFVCAGAERAGLTEQQALAAVTSSAARILGVADRVGSLAPGKDGDLLILSGSPTDPRSFVRTTVVDGRVVYERDPVEADAPDGGAVIVRAAEVHLGDGRVLTPGEVAFENGKIVEVGASVGVPPGARFIDLGDGAVMPGLIDALSHAGLVGDGGTLGGDLDTSTTTAEAAERTDPSFDLLAREGVTSVLTVPAGGGRVTGRGAVLKTAGPEKRLVVTEDAGLLVRLANERDIDAAAKQLDGLLKRAKGHLDALAKYEKEKKEYDAWKKKADADAKKAAAEAKKKAEAAKKDADKKDGDEKDGEKKDDAGKKPEPPKKDDAAKDAKKTPPAKAPAKKAPEKKEPVKPAENAALEGYRAVLEKKVPVYVRASTVEELRAALKLLSGQWKFRVVVVGGEEVRRMVGDLEKAKAGVIASPRVLVTEDGRPVNLLRELSISGLPAAVGTDAYLGGAELFELLAYAVSRGLSPSAAVRMATGDAAKLLGVADRVGTLAPGRDADLILLTGTPFGAGSRIRAVYAGGREVDRDEE